MKTWNTKLTQKKHKTHKDRDTKVIYHRVNIVLYNPCMYFFSFGHTSCTGRKERKKEIELDLSLP